MKIKIFLIIITILLGISAVCGENNTYTFADVQNAVDTDCPIIYLNNTEYKGEGSEINIYRDIVLDGAYENGSGISTLNANGLSGILSIDGNYGIVLKNINFINSNSNNGAVFVNNDGDLVIIGCNFNDNNGGAINCQGNLRAYNTNFTNNNKVNESATINIENYEPTLIDCYFGVAESTNPDLIVKNGYSLNISSILEDTPVTVQGSANTLGLIGSKNYQFLMYNPLYEGTYPTKYDLRDYGYTGVVKHQGMTGTCWANAAISTLEACILKATNGDNVFPDTKELSVANMVNLIMDYIDTSVTYDTGSYGTDAIAYLVSWMGPVLETTDPWSNGYHYSEITDSVVHVQNALNLPARKNATDLNEIKQAILDYGAIYTIYCNYAYANEKGDTYGETYDPNHDIAIIGWDDSYSRYNFDRAPWAYPPGDGAFIIQNSWGDNWGQNGFAYVSYYDASILGRDLERWTFIFNDTVRYNKNYQNSLSAISNKQYYPGNRIVLSETFTSTGNDYLAAYSTYLSYPCYIDAEIIVNNEVKLTQTNLETRSGYFTYELEKFIPLKNGDKFTVKLTYRSIDENPIKIYQLVDGSNPIKAFTSESLFEAVQTKINNSEADSEVFLGNKTYWASNGEVPIIINKNITLNGGDKNGVGISVLDANNLISIFEIANGCSVTLKNINLINSKGTAITVANGAIATILNCNFVDNEGETGNSILINGKATVKNCNFNSDNNGISEIYVNGEANFDKNKITSTNAGIYNKGTITSTANLVFNNGEGYLNLPYTLTANLTDDNGNIIGSNKNIESNNLGLLTYEDNKWSGTYTPTTIGNKTVTGTILGFDILNVRNGILTVVDDTPIIVTGGKFSYGTSAYVNVVLSSSKYGIYNIYVNGVKKGTYNLNSLSQNIPISDLNSGKYTIKIESTTDSSYSGITTLEITQIKPTLTVSSSNANYGEEITIEVTLKGLNDANLNGQVIVNINDEDHIVNVVDGKGTIKIKDLPVKGYEITATSVENENYISTSAKTDIAISKITPQISLIVNNYIEGEVGKMIVTTDERVTGNIELYLIWKLANRALNNGKVEYELNGLTAGTYSAYVIYNGDDNHYGVTVPTISFTVSPAGNIAVSGGIFEYGATSTVTITTPISGNVNVYVDNNKIGTYTATSSTLNVNLPPLNVGIHTVKVEYASDTSKMNTATVEIIKATPTLTITAGNINYGQNLPVSVELKAGNTGLNGAITININGKDYPITLSNGNGVTTITDLKANVYTLTATYSGNENYLPVETKKTITVSKIASTVSIDTILNENIVTIIATVTTGSTGTVEFYIDGNKVGESSIYNGKAEYISNTLTEGSHNIYAIYVGDDNYNTATSTTKTVTVESVKPVISITGGTFNY
ncbi:MAG: Ig-like domain repeat protein, partial [Methanobrevibacter sp.]|nr:Ig-like domain repeat protein [Methanobrevibacter sp.]